MPRRARSRPPGHAAQGVQPLGMKLTRPCSNCPFRTDVPGYLRQSRAEEIVEALTQGCSYFTCHKTTVTVELEDGEEDTVDGPRAQHCAGALIMLEKMGAPSQLMRIYERFNSDGNGYDPKKLDMDAPVFDDADAFVDHHDD